MLLLFIEINRHGCYFKLDKFRNFVCIVFKQCVKMLTLSSMENPNSGVQPTDLVM